METQGGDASVPTPLSLGVDVSHPLGTGMSLLGDSLVRFISQKKTYGESGGNSQMEWLSWLRRETVTFEIRGSNPLSIVFFRMM